MFKKEEEKAKVGRPRLADNDQKKKAIIAVAISFALVLALVVAGTFTLTGGKINTVRLKGDVKGSTTPPTKKPGVCKAVLTSGNSVNYKISCNNDAKIKSAYYTISGVKKSLKVSGKSSSGIIKAPTIQLVPRNVNLYVTYYPTGSGSTKTIKSNEASTYETTGDSRVSRISSMRKETTHCKVYILGVSNTEAKYGIKCDANAKPTVVQLNGADNRVLSTNWKENYGYQSSNFKVTGLTKGKKYKVRVGYYFIDEKTAKDNTIVLKFDSFSSTNFTAGVNLDETSKYNETNKSKDKEEICHMSGKSDVSGSLGYEIDCGKRAYPISFRVEKVDEETKRSWTKVKTGTINLTYTATYTNGKELTKTITKTITKTTRKGYDTEAKAQGVEGLRSYGMKETGKITKLKKGEYNLILYYGYKKSDGTNVSYVKTTLGPNLSVR